jgi:hypothetical protein
MLLGLWSSYLAHVVKIRNTQRILVGEHEAKRSLGGPRRR